MSITRIVRLDEIRPTQVIFVILVCATVAGSCLLTTGPTSTILHDGARAWSPNSWLRAVVGVLDLNYSQTTAKGVAIKSLVFGVGAAVALLVLGGSLLIRPRAGEELAAGDRVVSEVDGDSAATADSRGFARSQIDPLLGAQLLAGMLLVYSFVGIQWAQAPELALGGTLLLGTGLGWAFALGHGLKARSATASAIGVLIALLLTALMAIWYHHERNPVLRASYPIGNPLFLAACLLPGLLLAGAFMAAAIQSLLFGRRCPSCRMSMGRSDATCPQCGVPASADSPLRLAIIAWLCAGMAGTIGWAFRLAGGRGAMVGLVAGAGFGVTLLLPKRLRRYALLSIAISGIGLLGWFYSDSQTAVATGRDATVRLRFYAWDYALDLVTRKPLLGHGQGGFVALGDSLAARDVESDPFALDARLTHAHNEWLELLTDLGSIGAVLWIAALGLTVLAGIRAVDRAQSLWTRYALAGLLASLAAIGVEETFSVGMHVAGLPTVFYTILGLTWALSTTPRVAPATRTKRARFGRPVAILACFGGALVVGQFNLQDFQGARAGYDFPASLAELDFDRAVDQARTARMSRLNPHRRLAAIEQLSALHLQIARYQLESARHRMIRGQEEGGSSNLEQLAREDLSEAVVHHGYGMAALGDLYRAAPGYWNANRLLAEFSLVQAELLASEGDTDRANQQLANAVAALRQELLRRPFNIELSMRLVEVAGPGMSAEELIDVLARPLRAHPLTPAYVDFVLNTTQQAVLTDAFNAIEQEMRTALPQASLETWPTPWAPEALRLNALLRFRKFEYTEAEDALETAVSLYDQLPIDALLASAHAIAELADCRFFGHPNDAELAIETAQRSLAVSPDSEPGRALRAVVQARMLRYQLSAGREKEVRAALQAGYPDVTSEMLDAEIGTRYANMCASFRHRQEAAFPPRYKQWIERAAELNPGYDVVWRLKADLAFEEGRDDESVAYLVRALQVGADPNLVIAFVQLALIKRPDGEPFQQLHARLLEHLQKPPPTPAADRKDDAQEDTPDGPVSLQSERSETDSESELTPEPLVPMDQSFNDDDTG